MFEKKNGKRFLASVMALVMLLSLAPVGALAADETPTNEECSAMPLPAVEGKDQQANENTPTEPTENSDSAEATKPEGDLDEGYSNADTSNNDNGIAAQNLSLNEPAQEQSITAEYWVTNRRVTAENSQSKIIKSEDVNGATGKSVSELAPANGTCEDMDSVFWQARVLSGNDRQTMANNSTSVDKGVEITTIKYENNQFEYQTVNGEWKTFNSDNNEQLVFYYLIHTNFVKDVQINISDWPLLDNKDSQFIYSSRFVKYEIYDNTEDSTKPISERKTWYNQARTISSVQVTMNENDEYRIDRIDRSYTYNDNWSDNNATSGVGSTFSIALNQNNNQYNAIVRIYVTKLRHELTVEYKSTSDATEIRTASKFYQLINVNCEDYFNSNFNNDGTLKDNASVTVIGNQTISRDVAGYRFNHADMSADKKTLTFYYDQLFKVTYDANGGTGNLPTEAEYVAGDEVTVASQGNLEKTDCTFAGWKKGDEVVNGTFTMPAQNVTLTAQWTKTDPSIDTPEQVAAMFFINLGGKDASNPDGIGNFTNEIKIPNALNKTTFEDHLDNSMGSNHGFIFNIEGVKKVQGCEGTNLLIEEPDTDTINQRITDKGKNDMTVGGNTGREVVWYHVSHCDNGYHVDGYVKGVPITLTYHENFGTSNEQTVIDKNNSGTTLNSGDKVTIQSYKQVFTDEATQHQGWTFVGWFTANDQEYEQKETTLIDNVDLYAKWEKNYTVNFIGNGGVWDSSVNGYTMTTEDGKNIKATKPITVTPTTESTATVSKIATDPTKANHNFLGWSTTTDGECITDWTSVKLSQLADNSGQVTFYAQWTSNEPLPTTAKYTVKHHKWDVAQNKYIEDTSKARSYDETIGTEVNVTDKATSYEGYVLNKQISKLTGTVAANNELTLNLYYDIDKIGETTKENPNGGSDDIPDRYQVTINYVTDNTGRGKITGLTKEVKTIKDATGNPINKGTVMATGSTAEATGSRNYFSNWANDAGLPTSSTAKLGKQTFNAEGGETYTFTANFGYSGGGGSGGSNRPKPPVVEIPDDVPTGLNGKDHYAYIIGYGNNDVRPQNNITRAEVATIFFRLLTDETREANMTKSNGYNDVKDGDWFCCAVSTLSKMGIIKGYEDGSFKPNDPISRAEFAAIAARFDPDGDKTPATFADVTSHWAKDEISIAANHGWIKGYEDGSFKPDQKITRAETMTLVNRVLNRLPEAKDDLHKDMKTWVDNMDETAWYYLAVQEATNSHYFNTKTGTKFEQWTELRDTRDWSELEK